MDGRKVNQTPNEIQNITKKRLDEMDADAQKLPQQRQDTTIQHLFASFSTPHADTSEHTSLNPEVRMSQHDARWSHERRSSLGGNDGKGGQLFSSLTKMKRTDAAKSVENFEDQNPPRGFMGKAWRKYISGDSIPNSDDTKYKGQRVDE